MVLLPKRVPVASAPYFKGTARHVARCRWLSKSGLMKRDRARQGLSLVEMIVVMTIVGILISMSAPKFNRSIEQSQADMAGAKLQAIWTAQRLYWLEERSFASDLAELQGRNLIDSTSERENARYRFAISFADADSFVAAATRTGSERWSGQFSIDEQGLIRGELRATGQPVIVPGFQ